MRPLDGVDVVADVRRLPFEPGSLDELMSAHLVEHFRGERPRGRRCCPTGARCWRATATLRIICPNWEAMTRRLADGRMTWDEFKVLTFGLQDYDGDDHFAMYTPATLTDLLERTGFGDVELVAEDRMNGMCPEMELTARPAGAAGGTGEEAAAGLGGAPEAAPTFGPTAHEPEAAPEDLGVGPAPAADGVADQTRRRAAGRCVWRARRRSRRGPRGSARRGTAATPRRRGAAGRLRSRATTPS